MLDRAHQVADRAAGRQRQSQQRAAQEQPCKRSTDLSREEERRLSDAIDEAYRLGR